MTEQIRRAAAAAAFIVLAVLPVTASDFPGAPRIIPSEKAVYFAENTDAGDWRSLLELAYWASGAELTGDAAALFESAAAEAESLTDGVGPVEAGQAVLDYMHNNFLKRYIEKQTRLDRLVADGSFNCVSSAVLYTILGTAAGLEINGVRTSDHAFCSLSAGPENIDVETTSIYGFDPGSRTDFHDAFGRTTGYAYVAPGNYRDRQNLDRMDLFALILVNRISALEASGRYSEAVGLAADRWLVTGGGTGPEYEELIDRMINYGAGLAKGGSEELAVQWARSATAEYGPHPKWNDFYDSAVNNIVVRLIRQNRAEEARSRFEELKSVMSDSAALKLESTVADSEIMSAYNRALSLNDNSIMEDALAEAENAGLLSEQRISEVREAWLVNRLNMKASSEGWLAAYEEAGRFMAEYGSSRKLEEAVRVYRQNRFAELYNSAVTAYNRRQFTEALETARAALDEFPGDSRLQKLFSAAEKAIAGGN